MSSTLERYPVQPLDMALLLPAGGCLSGHLIKSKLCLSSVLRCVTLQRITDDLWLNMLKRHNLGVLAVIAAGNTVGRTSCNLALI